MRPKDENKIEQIYTATLELVLEKGLAGTTMCDICKAAGIATGTLYIYFTNKEELINNLFTVCRQESADFYFKDYSSDESFDKSFKKIFQNIVEYRLLNFEHFIFLEQCYHSPFISEEIRQHSLKKLDPLYRLIEKGISDGFVRSKNKHLVLGFVVGTVNEIVKHAHYNKNKVDRKLIESLYEMCWNGIKN